jgi:hypothetical protein
MAGHSAAERHRKAAKAAGRANTLMGGLDAAVVDRADSTEEEILAHVEEPASCTPRSARVKTGTSYPA